MGENKIPEATISRLSIYLRCLKQLKEDRVEIVSSEALALASGYKAAQIRKDLAYFGELGVRGLGYYVEKLKRDIKRILGLTKIWNVALVGAGNLGSALLLYDGLIKYGFRVVAVFDKNPEKTSVKVKKLYNVLDIDALARTIKSKHIEIAIITVPADSAQDVVNKLIDAGISAILNFAPVKLFAPPNVKIKNVDFSVELGGLSFFLTSMK